MTAVPNWRKTKWGNLKDELDRLDCDLDFCNVPASIHVLTESSSNSSSRQNFTSNKKDKLSECYYCHKFGHQARHCRKKQAGIHKKGARVNGTPARNPFEGISQGVPAGNLFQGISKEQLSLIIRTIQGVTEQLSL